MQLQSTSGAITYPSASTPRPISAQLIDAFGQPLTTLDGVFVTLQCDECAEEVPRAVAC